MSAPGDLGAPVYGARGDLLGVVSSGVLDGDGRTPASQRFTRIDAWLRRSSAPLQGSRGARP